jgi:hypothetical protein
MGIKTNIEQSPIKDKEVPQAHIQSLQLTPSNAPKSEVAPG